MALRSGGHCDKRQGEFLGKKKKLFGFLGLLNKAVQASFSSLGEKKRNIRKKNPRNIQDQTLTVAWQSTISSHVNCLLLGFSSSFLPGFCILNYPAVSPKVEQIKQESSIAFIYFPFLKNRAHTGSAATFCSFRS